MKPLPNAANRSSLREVLAESITLRWLGAPEKMENDNLSQERNKNKQMQVKADFLGPAAGQFDEGALLLAGGVVS
jgi:hypothetical protein